MNSILLRSASLALCAVASLSGTVAQAEEANHFTLSITDKGCTPNEVKVPAGDISITLTNDSKKAIEWEILAGVKVVFEKEHILPGFKMELKAHVEPGTYDMTCGLLSNPKGKLTAEGEAKSGDAAKPDEKAAKLASDYIAYARTEAGQFEAFTRQFVDAVKAGKLEDAQKLYPLTRVHYERIEPVAELFSDLDASLDARADSFEKKEADPNFIGFHRIEKALFDDKKLDGMGDVADRLLADVLELNKRLAALNIQPDDVMGGAQELIEEIAKSKISGEEEKYSGTDLHDIQANLDGSASIIQMARPLIADDKKELLDKIDGNFVQANAVLRRYRDGDSGFKAYSALTPEDTNALKARVTALAEDLATLKGGMGF